jgi:ABC-type xylose transport system permease subunit
MHTHTHTHAHTHSHTCTLTHTQHTHPPTHPSTHIEHTHRAHTHTHTQTHLLARPLRQYIYTLSERERERERERESARAHTHTHTLFVSSVFWTFFLSLCFSQAGVIGKKPFKSLLKNYERCVKDVAEVVILAIVLMCLCAFVREDHGKGRCVCMYCNSILSNQ